MNIQISPVIFSASYQHFHQSPLIWYITCGTTRNRTGDTRIFSPLLYQLSYGTITNREKPLRLRSAMHGISRSWCKGSQNFRNCKSRALFFSCDSIDCGSASNQNRRGLPTRQQFAVVGPTSRKQLVVDRLINHECTLSSSKATKVSYFERNRPPNFNLKAG